MKRYAGFFVLSFCATYCGQLFTRGCDIWLSSYNGRETMVYHSSTEIPHLLVMTETNDLVIRKNYHRTGSNRVHPSEGEFAWWKWEVVRQGIGPDGDTVGPLVWWTVTIPIWQPMLLLSILPLVWVRQFRKHLRIEKRTRLGLCQNCGYDLRATPDRCPECGHVVAKDFTAKDAEGAEGRAD